MNRAGSIGGHLGTGFVLPVSCHWIRRQKISAFSKHDLMRSLALTGAWKGNMQGHSPLLGFSTEVSQRFPACFYRLFNLNSISSHFFVLFFFRYRYNGISMGKQWSLWKLCPLYKWQVVFFPLAQLTPSVTAGPPWHRTGFLQGLSGP